MNTAFLPDPASLRVRVVRKEALTKDIVLIELASVDGQPLPTFTAGAHIDVQLPGGLTRQYSLCDTAAETYQIAVLKDPQGRGGRSEEHTSELQSLMRIWYAVFCLKKKKNTKNYQYNHL